MKWPVQKWMRTESGIHRDFWLQPGQAGRDLLNPLSLSIDLGNFIQFEGTRIVMLNSSIPKDLKRASMSDHSDHHRKPQN